MNEPTAAERLPVADTTPDGRSGRGTLSRVTGAAGLVTLLAVVGASLVDGYQNQSMTAAAPAILSFFRSLDDRLGWLMSYVTSVGLIACLWFAIGLALTLRPRPSRSAARSGSSSRPASSSAGWTVAGHVFSDPRDRGRRPRVRPRRWHRSLYAGSHRGCSRPSRSP